ncbi:heme ABC transporter permease [Thiohalocapsa halophila]|uniref:Heme ABC transporter permease n=1 Tax=Thiohalocapsa halophila TaxID=69359 RepID=A0ABS1CEW7_9GAMM|nr:iron chelate uptake ABC transporter family permease subunit [Thiohalocapsa halophila]MBK1630442.1 heme ABC transporter permease [Thiohalocapsa halophila]
MHSTAIPLPAGGHSLRQLLRRHQRQRLSLLLLVSLVCAVALLSIAIGPVNIPLGDVLRVLAGFAGLPAGEVPPQHEAVILSIRLPRTLLGLLVGAGLAVAGAAMQGLFRNPLADPGLIGVSAGAALAAVSVIVLGGTGLAVVTDALGPFSLPIAAFAGGLTTTLLVYRLASSDGRTSVTTLLLAGIAINALCGAGTGLLTYLADDQQLRTLTFWSMGSLGGASWPAVGTAALFIAVPLLALPLLARTLNALLLGEAEAGHLGIAVQQMQRIILETVVERPPGCVPRGVQQGTTRRNSRPIPTSCNAAGRRAGRAMGVVAARTREVTLKSVRILKLRKHL